MLRYLVVALLASACAADPVSAFNTDRIEAVCAWYERCGTLADGGYSTAQSCRTDLAEASKASGSMSCEDFSEDAAAECIAAWDDADCVTPPDLAVCEDVCTN